MQDVKLEGMDEVQQLLKHIGKRTDDTRALTGEIANTLYNVTMESFASQSSPAGVPWQRLSDVTLRRKKHKGKILYESGQLHRRIYHTHDDTTATVGVNLPYAAIHQFGGKAGRGGRVHIPQRPYLPLQESGDLYPKAWEEIAFVLEAFAESLGVG